MDVHLSISQAFDSLRTNPGPQDSPPRPPTSTKVFSSAQLLLSGAISGALAKSAIAPLDRMKILFQTNPNLKFNLANLSSLSREIYGSAGVLAFWKGHTATLVRVIPYSATNFFVFDRTKNFLGTYNWFNDFPVGLKFVSGALSGSVAVIVTYPLETLRARLAVDLESRYQGGYWTAIRSIVRADGLRSLYSGLRPTLLGIIPYAGSSFAIYETFRKDQTSFGARLLIGAIAGFAAQASTYPLDVVRRRMQVSPEEYPTIASTFMKVYSKEGLLHGLYKGLSMNAFKGPIAVAISLNVNDQMKQYFASHNS